MKITLQLNKHTRSQIAKHKRNMWKTRNALHTGIGCTNFKSLLLIIVDNWHNLIGHMNRSKLQSITQINHRNTFSDVQLLI